MRVCIDIGAYSICFCSWANYPYEMHWQPFTKDGGYPEIIFYWWKFYLTTDDF